MPNWDIEPGGVRRVTSHVTDVLDALAELEGAYGKNMAGSAASAGVLVSGTEGGGSSRATGLVAAALVEFIEGTAEEMKFIGERAGKSVTGALLATAAYETGDLHMAATIQGEAANIIDPTLDMPGALKRGQL
ncbi:DUF6507 family protein [Actinomycetota bacterium Odt1-20B]